MKGLIALKLGTKNLMVNGRLEEGIFSDIARQVDVIEEEKKKVVIISSGAIQAGRERMSDLKLSINNLTKKDLAGIGARGTCSISGAMLSPATAKRSRSSG